MKRPTRMSIGWIVFGILLILPRVLRLLDPDVHIEDPNYIYGAFLILKGMVPFAEFAQVNPPVLETFLAQLYRIFGVGHRIPEVLSAVAFLCSAVLIFRLGCRWMSRVTGIVAALTYSWHFLLFRYHVFERETFATLAVLAGLDLVLRRENDRPAPFIAGLIMGVGFACKQTALVQFLAVASALFLLWRRRRDALVLSMGFGLMTGLMTLGYTAVFGRMYMDQTFWFHWIKGFVAPWTVKAGWTVPELGFLVPPAVAGLWGLRRPDRDVNWIWPVLVVSDLAFFWWVSGAFWPHYLLSTIPSVCMMAGMFAGTIRPLIRRPPVQPEPASDAPVSGSGISGPVSRLRSAVALITASFAILLMQVFLPGALSGSGSTTRFGFSGTPRAEVAAAAAAIRNHTSETDLIISDPFIGLEARRIKVVRFKDNWGLILWMQRMMERGEYREAVAKLSRLPFGEIRFKSHQYWMPLIETAFATGSVGAVQPNYELPMDPGRLRAAGMEIVFEGPHYTIWAKKSGP